jgi:hypothetical protein
MESAPSEIQTRPKTNLAGAHGARWHQEGIEESLTGRGGRRRAERTEVYELAAKAEHSLVQDVVEFDHGAQPNLVAQLELARHAEIENELARADAGVARQVSGLADRRLRKLIQDRRIDCLARTAPHEGARVAAEKRPVVPDVIEVSIRATEADVERSAGSDPQNRRDVE